ncbi:MAG: type II toxin-antitoxin system HicA family toxin [Armatimonadetes bacterium]|nr:type II toxin-antitoxin system HicA family toxin [Armatimonadota bacterium]
MPEGKASEFQRVARGLGFSPVRQTGSHQRWRHTDGRATTIPIHPSATITPPLFYIILRQLGISEDDFNRLK